MTTLALGVRGKLQRTPDYAISRKLRVRSEHLIAEGKNEHRLGVLGGVG